MDRAARGNHGLLIPIRDKLLAWFHEQARRLPWRGSNDPYAIWVSEVMLQQTTVGAVRGRYEAFLARFPDVASLASAPRESVLAEWSGLGYYARARNLHAAAEMIARDHGGKLPSQPSVLRELPGFGEYMSAAVPSIAYGVRAPAADANVDRVVSRLFAIGGLAGSRAHKTLVLAAMDRLLPDDRPGDLIAAFMDLGQTICTPRRPACGTCPLLSDCAGAASGDPVRYPQKPARAPMARVAYAAADARLGSRILMVRRPAGWLAGMWELPSAEGATPGAARRALARRVRELGLRLDLAAPRHFVSHTIMRRRLDVEIVSAVPAVSGTWSRPRTRGARWFLRRELAGAAIPTLTRKIARAGGFLRADV